MIKKIFKYVLILAVVGIAAIALMGYGTYKVADNFVKEKEPQLRQYVQLDEAGQNQFVLEHIGEFLSAMEVDLDKDGKPDDKESIKKLMTLNERPEIKSALADLGRSIIASVVLLSEPIVKDMTPQEKAKYIVESEETETRADKYSKLIEAADPSFKVEK